MKTVDELMNEIKARVKESNCCTTNEYDENRFIRSMLSDDTYEVEVFRGKEGKIGTFSPAKAFKSVCASVLQDTAHINSEEAKILVKDYYPSKDVANNVIGIAKEFINSYLETGRKLSLGGRKDSDIAIAKKEIKGGTKSFPKPIGTDKDGKVIYGQSKTTISPYTSIKVISPCPKWKK